VLHARPIPVSLLYMQHPILPSSCLECQFVIALVLPVFVILITYIYMNLNIWHKMVCVTIATISFLMPLKGTTAAY
jgi:hypothetical protein